MVVKEEKVKESNLEHIKEYIKNIIDYDILLSSLGFSIYRSTDSEIRASCAIHCGDNQTSFCLRRSSGRFYCFSHNCHINESGAVDNDVIALVRRCKNCSFEEAIRYLGGICGVDLDNEVEQEKIDKVISEKERNTFIREMGYFLEPPAAVGADFIREAHSKGCPYFEAQGVSKDIINKYMLGTYTDSRGEERASVPIYNDEGLLVGCSGRATRKDYETKKIPKYDISEGLKKGTILYNLNNARFINSSKSIIIIVEGFKALWHIVSCGYENVVAVMGNTIVEDQVYLLLKYGFQKVLLFLDWNEAGINGTKNSMELLDKYSIENYYIPAMSDDFNAEQPDDLSCNQINELLYLFT